MPHFRYGYGVPGPVGSDGTIWRANFDLLPLSTSANASELRAALAAMGLTLTRASAATVQTSASEVVTSGIGVDDPRVGLYGLVIEEIRRNDVPSGRDTTAVSWTAPSGGTSYTYGYAAGPDGAIQATRHQILSGGYSRYYTAAGGIVGHINSLWLRSTSAAHYHVWQSSTAPAGGSEYLAINPLPLTWGRQVGSKAAAGAVIPLIAPGDMRGLGGTTAAASDVISDMHQSEVGKFATEYIPTTGAAATRAAEYLRYRDTGLVRSGRMRLELDFIAKGASSDPTAPLLAYFDASNYIYHRAGSDNRITLFLGGISFTTTGTVTWSANQRVRLFLEFGSGASSVWSKIDDGAAQSTTNASVIGALPSVAPYIMSGLASNPMSAWIQRVRAYAPGRRPAWAA